MSNILTERKQIEVIRLLMESGSINGVSRLTGVHRGTIRRLMVRFGEGCRRFLDWEMQDLKLEHVQCDEIKTFNRKKQGTANDQNDNSKDVGEIWLFVAMDEKSRLIPTFRVDKRDLPATESFISDLIKRLRDDNPRPHDSDAHAYKPEGYKPVTRISTDGLELYQSAIKTICANKVEYGYLVKRFFKVNAKANDSLNLSDEEIDLDEFFSDSNKRRKKKLRVEIEKKIVLGDFDENLITTSLIERSNLTTRNFIRRLARRTMCFSKKLENLKAAVAIHYAVYNYCWSIQTFRQTPAMVAGLTDRKWSHADLFEHIRSNWPDLFFLEPASA